eukprot:s382_g28.t1
MIAKYCKCETICSLICLNASINVRQLATLPWSAGPGFAPRVGLLELADPADDVLSLPMIKYAEMTWQAQEMPKIAFGCSQRNEYNLIFGAICYCLCFRDRFGMTLAVAMSRCWSEP